MQGIGYIGIMEKKMETTIQSVGFRLLGLRFFFNDGAYTKGLEFRATESLSQSRRTRMKDGPELGPRLVHEILEPFLLGPPNWDNTPQA